MESEKGSEKSSPENQQDQLNRLLDELRDPGEGARLGAMRELTGLNFSSAAILRRLETMALNDPDLPVREAALACLASASHRFIQKNASQLTLHERRMILNEVQKWQEAGLVQPKQADILKRRYDFDLAPAPAQAAVTAPAPPPQPAAPAAPPPPRPTLMQTLLSEASIKIALYLGAFLVIAAAAILAALVAAARLPILAAVTLGFGAAAAMTYKRLSQPSFVLFIVFSCLLPFNAAVMADLLNLKEIFGHLYWAAVFAVLAAIWAAAAWFYTSRFFSMASFVAVVISILFVSDAFDLGPEPSFLLLALAAGFGLLGVQLLKRWKDANFGLPLFGLTVFHTLLLALLMGLAGLMRAFDESATDFWSGYWAFPALAWIGISAYFFAANRLYRFVLFPWAAALSLLPVPWTLLNTFDPPALAYIGAYWMLGLLYTLAGELTSTTGSEQVRPYHWPLKIGAYLPLFAAWLWGAIENELYGFAAALGASILFGALTVRKPRALFWTSALIAALTAYFSFFNLPSIRALEFQPQYIIAAASALLLLPDLFLRAELGADKTMRWPPRVLGLLLAGFSLLVLMSPDISPVSRGITLSVFAFLALGYALRYRLGWAVYFFAAFLSIAVQNFLNAYNFAHWLPAQVALAFLYYGAGAMAGNQNAVPFRSSGLTLGALALLVAFINGDQTGAGWYSFLLAGLFVFEQYRHKQSWLEAGTYFFVSAGWWQILSQFGVDEAAYRLLGISILCIGLDLLIGKTYLERRRLKEAAVIGSALLSLITAGYLLIRGGLGEPRLAAIGFAIFTLAFLANALIRNIAWLGYSITASLALTVFFLADDLGWNEWLIPMIGLASVYFAAGFALRRRAMKKDGAISAPRLRADSWPDMWLVSGLGLGALLSLAAPAQGGIGAVIPVALAATLWTVEAFARRNVWLGFPSNALYLTAYFMILSTLNVDEPQFYSVVAAGLGLLMHYLLTRSGSRAGAFITGMVSQLALLSTTYLQMLSTGELIFFAVLFFQGLVVLVYGVVIRSRSLVAAPIVFIVLGVITVVYSALRGISTVIMIGCTGMILLLLGILAVVLRERLTRIGERFSEWQA